MCQRRFNIRPKGGARDSQLIRCPPKRVKSNIRAKLPSNLAIRRRAGAGADHASCHHCGGHVARHRRHLGVLHADPDGEHDGHADSEYARRSGAVYWLVVLGCDIHGRRHFLALDAGFRESAESWKAVLLSLRDRGVKGAKLAMGDGALGFWAALAEVYPETRMQRCWVHKTANVLDKLPKRLQAGAKSMPHEIWQAETRKSADKAMDRFVATYEAKRSQTKPGIPRPPLA